MFVANASRITWFLGLQRIVRFPKSFMAPSAVPMPGLRRLAYDPETKAKAFRTAVFDPGIAPRLRQLRPSVALTGKQPTAPATKTWVGPTRYLVPDGRSQISKPRANHPNARSIPAFTAPALSVQIHRPGTPASSPASVAVRERRDIRQLADTARFDSQGTPRSLSFNKILRSSPLPRLQPSLAPIATAPGQTTDQFSRADPSTKSPNRPDWGTEDRDPFDVTDRIETRSDNKPDVKGHSVSTLHIDGSALGQWAIQHLERALGRPATGMTGVDPRTTLPRSRVAPF
jgi:hypothetical protein